MAKKKDLTPCANECGKEFESRNQWHVTCGWQCAMEYHSKVLAKREANDKARAAVQEQR